MNVILDDGTKAYLKEHNHDQIVLSLLVSDCCTGDINSRRPDITYKIPKHMDQFNMFDVDGIKVYVGNDVKTVEDTLTFKLNKLIFRSAPTIEGIDLDNAGDVM